MITTYIMDITKLNQDEVFERYFSRMSVWRKEKINRARLRADKNRSLGAGILLARGLLAYGIEERNAVILEGEHGKPHLAAVEENGGQRAVHGVHFNLSHSGSYVAAAFADTEVGIDIEHIRRNWEKIADHFFAKEELRELALCENEGEKADLFLRYWTVKESGMKVSGEGMRIPLRNIRLCGEGSVCLQKEDRSWKYVLKEFEIPDQSAIMSVKKEHNLSDSTQEEKEDGSGKEKYRIAVCAREGIFAQQLIWVEE